MVTKTRRDRGIRIRGESIERLRALAKQALEDTVRDCQELGVPLETVVALVHEVWGGEAQPNGRDVDRTLPLLDHGQAR